MNDEIIYTFKRGQGWVAGYREPTRDDYYKFTKAILDGQEQRWLRMHLDYMRTTYIRHTTITGVVAV